MNKDEKKMAFEIYRKDATLNIEQIKFQGLK